MSSQQELRLRQDIELTPLSLKHAPNMFRWMSDPAVAQNLGLRREPSLEKTQAWIENAIADPQIAAFAVLGGGQHIGNVVLDRIDSYLGTARMSVYIGEASARGSGAGLTSIYLVLLHGFEQLALHKIWLTVHTRNLPAINAYLRLGFKLEGILRDEFWLDGQRVDALYMGLLYDEFRNLAIIK